MSVPFLRPRQCILLALSLGAIAMSACGRSKSNSATATPAPTPPVATPAAQEQQEDETTPELPAPAADDNTQAQAQSLTVVFLNSTEMQASPTPNLVKFSVIGLDASTNQSDIKYECKLSTQSAFDASNGTDSYTFVNLQNGTSYTLEVRATIIS